MSAFLIILFIVVGISAVLAIALAQNAHKADEVWSKVIKDRDSKQNKNIK